MPVFLTQETPAFSLRHLRRKPIPAAGANGFVPGVFRNQNSVKKPG
jgi:hypothetical protein